MFVFKIFQKTILFIFILFIFSCKKENNDTVGSAGLLEINNNVAANSARISPNTVSVIFPLVSYGPQTGVQNSSIDIGSEYNLKLIAEVASPISGANTLQASFVAVNGNTAYVGYNTRGDAYLGAIDVIDVSDVNNPLILQSAVLQNIDVTVLHYENNKLYFGGARNVDAFTGVVGPAFVGYINLTDNKLTNDVQLKELTGFLTNSISINSNELIASTGNTGGGIYILDKSSLEINEYFQYNGVKDVITNTQNYVAIEGSYEGSSNQTIKSFAKSNKQVVSSHNLPTGIFSDARCNIADYQDNLLIANGFAGISYMNLNNGILFDQIGLPDSMVGVDSLDIYCNGVSYDNQYVYAANGAAGLTVSQITGANTFEILGKADLLGSANFVVGSNGNIYVASGTQGLKILKLEAKENPSPSIPCETRPNLQSNPNGDYVVNSGEEQYYQSPGNNGNTQLGGVNINSNGLFDFCGRLTIKNNCNIDGVLYIRGDLEINKDATINGNGRLKIEGSVKINGNLNFNGTIEFVTAGCVFEVKKNLNKNGSAVVINPQFNTGPTIIP